MNARFLAVVWMAVACSGDEPAVFDSGLDSDTGVALRSCDADHPMVGWTAELSTLQHDVSGTVTILDDCTAEITDFDFDGQGIDVRLYGAVGGDYDNGFPMTDDLVRQGGYSEDTVLAGLPAGMTWDDADSVSIWCVDFAIDFGSGSFSP